VGSVVEWVAADSAVGWEAAGRVVEQAVAATGGVQSQSTFQRRQQGEQRRGTTRAYCQTYYCSAAPGSTLKTTSSSPGSTREITSSTPGSTPETTSYTPGSTREITSSTLGLPHTPEITSSTPGSTPEATTLRCTPVYPCVPLCIPVYPCARTPVCCTPVYEPLCTPVYPCAPLCSNPCVPLCTLCTPVYPCVPLCTPV